VGKVFLRCLRGILFSGSALFANVFCIGCKKNNVFRAEVKYFNVFQAFDPHIFRLGGGQNFSDSVKIGKVFELLTLPKTPFLDITSSLYKVYIDNMYVCIISVCRYYYLYCLYSY